MADTFEIEIATPERLLAREQAIRAQIPAAEGYVGVLPDHAPLLSELGISHTFLTNNPSKSTEDYLKHLRSFGLLIDAQAHTVEGIRW